jgi:hypothetical protein
MTARTSARWLLAPAMACVVGTSACNRGRPPQPPSGGGMATATAAAPAAQPAAGADDVQAIAAVKSMIDGQGGLAVTVSSPSTQLQTRLLPCSPQENDADKSANPDNPELWQCTSPSGDPPFMKRVTTTTTQTQTTTVRVPSSQMSNWGADPAPDDKWRVHAVYDVQGQHHSASWLVDRQNLTIGAPTEA